MDYTEINSKIHKNFVKGEIWEASETDSSCEEVEKKLAPPTSTPEKFRTFGNGSVCCRYPTARTTKITDFCDEDTTRRRTFSFELVGSEHPDRRQCWALLTRERLRAPAKCERRLVVSKSVLTSFFRPHLLRYQHEWKTCLARCSECRYRGRHIHCCRYCT